MTKSITLNKLNIEIDGTIYQFYKLTFRFQRQLIEVQSEISKLTNELAKKYSVPAKDISENEAVSDEEKLELAKKGLELQDALATLFVNPEEAKILGNFDGDSLEQLIEILR